MQALVVPEKVVIEINRLLFRFLWRKKDCNRRAFEKVKKSVLCTDVESGGLNMTGLKVMQLYTLCNEPKSCWDGNKVWLILRVELFYKTADFAWMPTEVHTQNNPQVFSQSVNSTYSHILGLHPNVWVRASVQALSSVHVHKHALCYSVSW